MYLLVETITAVAAICVGLMDKIEFQYRQYINTIFIKALLFLIFFLYPKKKLTNITFLILFYRFICHNSQSILQFLFLVSDLQEYRVVF
jgi:hypothetical protein